MGKDKKNKANSADDLFAKRKSELDKEKEKERKKLQKKAEKIKAEQDARRKEAERILDLDFVERRLAYEKKRDDKKTASRDGYLEEMTKEVLADQKETLTCAICGEEIGLGNITCPRCGSLYCMYCGFKMPDGENFTGKCPRCGGFQNFTPAKLVQTRVEDIPQEDRFWEQLNECPKCGGATQPEWDECPLCGAKLETKVTAAPAASKEEKTIASIKAQRKKELMERRRRAKETGPKRGI